MAAANTCTPNDNFVRILGILEKDKGATERLASALEKISDQLARGVSMGSSGASSGASSGVSSGAAGSTGPAAGTSPEQKRVQDYLDELNQTKDEAKKITLKPVFFSATYKAEQKLIDLEGIPNLTLKDKIMIAPDVYGDRAITSSLLSEEDYNYVLSKLNKFDKKNEYDILRAQQRIVEDHYRIHGKDFYKADTVTYKLNNQDPLIKEYYIDTPQGIKEKRTPSFDVQITLPKQVIVNHLANLYMMLDNIGATPENKQYWTKLILPKEISGITNEAYIAAKVVGQAGYNKVMLTSVTNTNTKVTAFKKRIRNQLEEDLKKFKENITKKEAELATAQQGNTSSNAAKAKIERIRKELEAFKNEYKIKEDGIDKEIENQVKAETERIKRAAEEQRKKDEKEEFEKLDMPLKELSAFEKIISKIANTKISKGNLEKPYTIENEQQKNIIEEYTNIANNIKNIENNKKIEELKAFQNEVRVAKEKAIALLEINEKMPRGNAGKAQIQKEIIEAMKDFQEKYKLLFNKITEYYISYEIENAIVQSMIHNPQASKRAQEAESTGEAGKRRGNILSKSIVSNSTPKGNSQSSSTAQTPNAKLQPSNSTPPKRPPMGFLGQLKSKVPIVEGGRRKAKRTTRKRKAKRMQKKTRKGRN